MASKMLDDIMQEAFLAGVFSVNAKILRDVNLPKVKGSYAVQLKKFKEKREKQYEKANFRDAKQRAANDAALYALANFDLNTLKRYVNSLNGKTESNEPKNKYAKPRDVYGKGLARIEIELTAGTEGKESWKKYNLIPVRNGYAAFFPGYKRSFVIETDAGEIKTHVTSANKGTRSGSYNGCYISMGLKPWFNLHPELKSGDKLILTRKGEGRYILGIKHQK